jgi:pimeloyl-ACP methyl ester carboxylesterase
MKSHCSIAITCLLISFYCDGQVACQTTINYGNNSSAGAFVKVNGIKMYYEVYGNPGNPVLLLIHGNGGNIRGGRCQIEHFKTNYRVIIADSRAHGKTEIGDKELTYELMADDYHRLLDHLKLKSVSIVGQSDGAIIGLLLAISHPDDFDRLVAMGPNLRADTTAIKKWAVDLGRSELAKIEKQITDGDTSRLLLRTRMQNELMDKYPNIPVAELKKIKIPVLVMAGDDDIIKPEHILEIYRAIPKANMAVLPGATHFALVQDPELFNYMVGRFLRNPFKRPTSQASLEDFIKPKSLPAKQ